MESEGPRHTPRKVSRESWSFAISPWITKGWKTLMEEAPVDEYRRNYQLVEPLRSWLDSHEHKVNIDRGDFGEGDEHYDIKVYSQEDANEFSGIIKRLKGGG